jgi:hypothetical protein
LVETIKRKTEREIDLDEIEDTNYDSDEINRLTNKPLLPPKPTSLSLQRQVDF